LQLHAGALTPTRELTGPYSRWTAVQITDSSNLVIIEEEGKLGLLELDSCGAPLARHVFDFDTWSVEYVDSFCLIARHRQRGSLWLWPRDEGLLRLGSGPAGGALDYLQPIRCVGAVGLGFCALFLDRGVVLLSSLGSNGFESRFVLPSSLFVPKHVASKDAPGFFCF